MTPPAIADISISRRNAALIVMSSPGLYAFQLHASPFVLFEADDTAATMAPHFGHALAHVAAPPDGDDDRSCFACDDDTRVLE